MSLTLSYQFYLKIYIILQIHFTCTPQTFPLFVRYTDGGLSNSVTRAQAANPRPCIILSTILSCPGTPLSWKTFYSAEILNYFYLNAFFFFFSNQVSNLPFCVIPFCAS